MTRAGRRELGSAVLLAGLVALVAVLVSGCGARTYNFKPHEVRGATKFLNRSASAAQPYIENVCQGSGADLRAFCRVLRQLYRGNLTLADGIDEAMNKADEQNQQNVDLDKVLSAGFKILDLVTEEEAVTRTAMKEAR